MVVALGEVLAAADDPHQDGVLHPLLKTLPLPLPLLRGRVLVCKVRSHHHTVTSSCDINIE